MTSLGLFLIAVFALMIWAVRQREFAFVHGGGLTLQRGRSRHDYSWEHLGDLKLSVIRYGLSWWVWGQRAHASITTDQGKHLHFRASMADMDPFAHAIKHYLYPLRLNEYRQRLKSKQTLQLGPIRCSPEGLVYRRKTYSWDSVESVHLDAGQLIIKTRQVDKMRTIRIATGRIPNPDLCAQFLGSIEY